MFKLGSSYAKQIYRSLIVISLTTVFGWFSTMFLIFLSHLIQIQIEQLYIDLLAGLFVNLACAGNFFVYYFMRWGVSLYN